MRTVACFETVGTVLEVAVQGAEQLGEDMSPRLEVAQKSWKKRDHRVLGCAGGGGLCAQSTLQLLSLDRKILEQ
jgi:hypothetical protein